ncbi:similar to Saccharomyces cerevisiae YLR376C PSY3 Protein involved in a Rad51p-, Rad54p-dependent pathway for homologous recombination repair [Maudiozyma barnettii]|uniref:Similar to Saccharomyces cerevisiae YLR376C PSY3 Protein involved in a Rad51p-, Rad54p-dependent pathway for homologous recombination repair n=1 Tax=Maudiozyma barnettii TaxID=61262 RepID=A0A8H2ZIT1_9SACH|nr:Psy3p [Kazachstania barnettii]CAB4257274.1 similar to Saccharomyces cerevisiae YLR376C PSY3 Protein involved in a Rad51p-, Rad54p-dependent pathway for homologous recombination repair [Kazachstania barnettii]CAD1784539.1 similar to Saccharomyces cerevisiae YLR376C PSY3 Protein involved in a Rad51p-, Rad54p-dependent pathway for homologous recombination repair [Kazachstania barnettii]
MEVLAHCKIYSLSQYYHPQEQLITIDPGITTTLTDSKTGRIRTLHLIEPDFKIHDFKRRLLKENITANGKVLIIDIVSAWKNTLLNDPLLLPNVWYANSEELFTLEGVICFLARINANPTNTLQRECSIDKNDCHQSNKKEENSLQGIIIDNLSYLHTDSTTDTKSLNILFKLIKNIQRTFGCWYVSTSLNNEFYQGIEHSFNSTNNTIMSNYVNDMDLVMVRDPSTKQVRQLNK